MMQVEAVVKMLDPGFNVCGIAAKRRNKSKPWFKRGTLFRSAVDVMRRAAVPMTAREIADTLVADKAPQATRKQAIDLQAAILVALRKRNNATVVGLARQRGGNWLRPRTRTVECPCPKAKQTGSAGKPRNAAHKRPRPISPLDKEAWLLVAADWIKLAQSCEARSGR